MLSQLLLRRLWTHREQDSVKTVRIANGQGFWGDSLQAPIEQVRRGPIDPRPIHLLEVVSAAQRLGEHSERLIRALGGRERAD